MDFYSMDGQGRELLKLTEHQLADVVGGVSGAKQPPKKTGKRNKQNSQG